MLSRSGDMASTSSFTASKPTCRDEPGRRYAIPRSETSKTYSGGGSCKNPVMFLRKLMILLDERHLVDFLQRCNAEPALFHRGVAQKRHSFFLGRALDLGRGPLVENHFANPIAQVQQLVNRGTAAESGTGTLET